MLLLLTACTDYALKGGDDDPRAPRDDTDPDPVVDSAEDTDTTPDTDSGDVTVPPDTGDEVVEPPSGKIDVVLVIDDSYWYDCYRVELPTRTTEIINALFASGANVAVAIATYDDYNVEGEWFAAWGGTPFTLDQQLTTDSARLLAVAAGLEFTWGGDGPGTGFEALLQVGSGAGYDQDCDHGFDTENDIRAFKPSSSDAFGGAASGSSQSSVPGSGTIGGVGFREGSARVVVLFAENAFRDRANGDTTPAGACPGAAGRTDAISALGEAKFLGINAYEFQDEDPELQTQLVDVAQSTGSKIDADGDGARDDTAVLAGTWDWPATPVIVEAIWDLVRP